MNQSKLNNLQKIILLMLCVLITSVDAKVVWAGWTSSQPTDTGKTENEKRIEREIKEKEEEQAEMQNPVKAIEGKTQEFNKDDVLVYEAITRIEGDTIRRETREYYDNGQLKVVDHHINGVHSGVRSEYSKDGVLLKEKNYKNGAPHGLSREYYPDGKLKELSNFRDGKLEGVYRVYYEQGALKMEANYRQNKLNGIKFFF